MDKTSHPAAKRLKSKKEEILSLWERRIREEVPESRNQPKEALRNSLPEMLEKIAHTLASPRPKHTAELEPELSIAKQHGEQRATLENYPLQQVIHEYQILRKTILQILEEKGPLTQEDRNVVLDAISLGERMAAGEFHRLQLESAATLEQRTQERDKAARERDFSRDQVSDLVSERGLRESFVFNLVHDLRTPLTAARMNLELLLKRRNEVGTLEIHAGRALDEMSRMERMIQDLLDANRIKSGEPLPIKVSRLRLDQEIQSTLETLGAVHGDRFVLEPSEPVEGYWDKTGIRRIIENLCINAVKYGDRTTPVTLSVRPDLLTQHVTLEVQNWGALIAPVDQARIFAPFRRIDSAGTQGSGWGIGLALVRGMAEAHGGRVHVQSTPEKGTVFSVLLPLDARPSLAAASA